MFKLCECLAPLKSQVTSIAISYHFQHLPTPHHLTGKALTFQVCCLLCLALWKWQIRNGKGKWMLSLGLFELGCFLRVSEKLYEEGSGIES